MMLYVFFLAFLANQDPQDLSEYPWVLYLCAGFFGIGEAVFYPFPSVMMSVFFMDKPEPAFGNNKFWQSLGSCVVLMLGPYITFQAQIVFQVMMLSLTMLSLFVLNRFVCPINAGVSAPPLLPLEAAAPHSGLQLVTHLQSSISPPENDLDLVADFEVDPEVVASTSHSYHSL